MKNVKSEVVRYSFFESIRKVLHSAVGGGPISPWGSDRVGDTTGSIIEAAHEDLKVRLESLENDE